MHPAVIAGGVAIVVTGVAIIAWVTVRSRRFQYDLRHHKCPDCGHVTEVDIEKGHQKMRFQHETRSGDRDHRYAPNSSWLEWSFDVTCAKCGRNFHDRVGTNW